MKWYTQSFSYDDPWSTVALAYFLRYPNPYASHILSCDVISRTPTAEGTLRTTRLILKRGVLPKWAPKGIISRAETWVIEESEVDPAGKTIRCITRNLDHVKVLQIVESVGLTETADGKTIQSSEARVISRFGWGLTRRIESLGVIRIKNHLEKSREGISLILKLIHESRLQSLALASTGTVFDRPAAFDRSFPSPSHERGTDQGPDHGRPTSSATAWGMPTIQKIKGWFQW